MHQKVLYLSFVHPDYGHLLTLTLTTYGYNPLLPIWQQCHAEERFVSVSRPWRVPGPHLSSHTRETQG